MKVNFYSPERNSLDEKRRTAFIADTSTRVELRPAALRFGELKVIRLAMQVAHLDAPASIIASARTGRESKLYDHAAVPNVPASKHNRHGRRNNRRHAYSMVDRQSPLRRSLGSHSRDSRTRSRDHIPSNLRRSRSRTRRPGMRHSNRHIPLLRRQYRGEEPKESVSPVWLPFPSRRNPSRGDQQCSYIYSIRIRERFRVLDLAIVAANTVAHSWSGPISCDSLFRVAQALIERLNHR